MTDGPAFTKLYDGFARPYYMVLERHPARPYTAAGAGVKLLRNVEKS